MDADLAGNSRVIAEYVRGASARTHPPEVLEAARMCLVDWAGVSAGARSEPAGMIVRTASDRWASQGRSTVLLGGRASAPVAALCNGTLAHCLDFDDTYVKANTHTSAPVWAATLAVGEEIGASEQQMLAAFVAGFDVAARVGHELGEAVTARGFHATGVFGRLGAAAAAAVLMGLDADSIQHALGTAATQVSGLTASFGTMSKPFHAGKAAMDGVMSAQLAADGFRAATHLLDVDGGLDTAIIQDRALTITPADFTYPALLQNSFKLYAACHLTHPAIDAARGVGVNAEQLERIRAVRADVGALAYQVTGGKSGDPVTSLAAKFDIRYCVALALAGRPVSAADFTDPLPDDPRLALLRDRIEAAASPAYGYASAGVEVVFDDGQRCRHEVAVARGHPGNPATWDDLEAKFNGLVTPVAGSTATRSVLAALRQFGREKEGSTAIASLSRSLSRGL